MPQWCQGGRSRVRCRRLAKLLGACLSCVLVSVASADEQRGEITRLVDSPTAGVIAKGRFGLDLRLFPEGGVMTQISAGVLERLTISVSYGGERIIGDQTIDWYPRLEAGVRYRAVEESAAWPAVVVGFETQGYGAYAADRYHTKSKGLFLAASKNYMSALGQIGVHGGANLTREDADGDGDLSGWAGADKSINADLSLVGEYDLGLDDNGHGAPGRGGLLNAGVCWSVAPALTVGAHLKNLLRSGPGDPQVSRELSVRYSEEF